jgi:hypothetical protein
MSSPIYNLVMALNHKEPSQIEKRDMTHRRKAELFGSQNDQNISHKKPISDISLTIFSIALTALNTADLRPANNGIMGLSDPRSAFGFHSNKNHIQ